MSTIPFHSKKLMAASSAQKEEKSLNGAEGGPPMDTVDSRLAKVEAKVDIIMSEISGWRRWMIGTAIAIFFRISRSSAQNGFQV